LGWLKILSFETSTGALASSMGDLHLWLLYVLFVAKMSQPGFTYVFVSRKYIIKSIF
jgi:hypothetical protein